MLGFLRGFWDRLCFFKIVYLIVEYKISILFIIEVVEGNII